MRFFSVIVMLMLSGCVAEDKRIPVPTAHLPVSAVPLARIRAHALAFGAVLNTANAMPLTTLTDAMEPNVRLPGEAGPARQEPAANRQSASNQEILNGLGKIQDEGLQATLVRQWQVHNREELLDTLQGLLQGGHRKAYAETSALLAPLPTEQIFELATRGGEWRPSKFGQVPPLEVPAPRNGKEMMERLVVIRHLDLPPIVANGHPTTPIAAWDYARYINLCDFGYRVKFLTEQEAWDRIEPMARLIQARYHSWAEFAADYIRGREFWSLAAMRDDGPEMRKIAEHLQGKDGLWTSIPWEESLGGGPVADDPYVPPAPRPAMVSDSDLEENLQVTLSNLPAGPAAPAGPAPVPSIVDPGEAKNRQVLDQVVQEARALDRHLVEIQEDQHRAAGMFTDLSKIQTKEDLAELRRIAELFREANAKILQLKNHYWERVADEFQRQGTSVEETRQRVDGLRANPNMRRGLLEYLFSGRERNVALYEGMLKLADLAEANWQQWSATPPAERQHGGIYRACQFNDAQADAAYQAIITGILATPDVEFK